MQTTAYNVWVFDSKALDWLNTINYESLTEYQPHSELLDLLTNRIDREKE